MGTLLGRALGMGKARIACGFTDDCQPHSPASFGTDLSHIDAA
jgi:hypothetical protein